jgi:predicted DNA-binding helix-hairpin-helix protein
MDTRRKLIILADAAKYGAACACVGTFGRGSSDDRDLESAEGGGGPCQRDAPDARWLSLPKLLFANGRSCGCKSRVDCGSGDGAPLRRTSEPVRAIALARQADLFS